MEVFSDKQKKKISELRILWGEKKIVCLFFSDGAGRNRLRAWWSIDIGNGFNLIL